MALEVLLTEENFGTGYEKKNEKGEQMQANGDVSCPGVCSVKKIHGNKSGWDIQKKGRNLERGRRINKRMDQGSGVFTDRILRGRLSHTLVSPLKSNYIW